MNLPFYHLPESAKPQWDEAGNRGLWYNRFFDLYQADWTIADTGKSDWVKQNARPPAQPQILQAQRDILRARALRQLALIRALNGRSAVFATDWHFVTGLGLPHPVENGLAWHHTLGTPYLAGSGVKGLIKAWVEVWDETLDDEEKQRRSADWFGATEQAGRFVFFDAVPVEPVQLAADVMTPHMAKWYEQGGEMGDWRQEPEKIPADWHAPAPVPFLVVKQAKLLFGIAPRHRECADQLKPVFEALIQALDWLGAGAKTAVGYGRMAEDQQASEHLCEEADQAARKAADALLSREQLAIRKLECFFEEEKNANRLQAGGSVVGRLNEWLKEGMNWPAEYREKLAILAEKIFDDQRIGWGSSPRRKERKAKIQLLREGR